MSRPASVNVIGFPGADRGRLRSEVAEAVRQIATIDWTGIVDELETREGSARAGERLEDAANTLLDLCDLISRHQRLSSLR